MRTIAEYNERLTEINSELEILKLEHQYIVGVLNVLDPKPTANGNLKPKPKPKNKKKTTKKRYKQMDALVPMQILGIIKDNPGISFKDLQAKLDPDYNPAHITSRLSDMRQKDQIENRGKNGRASRWYVKESA